MDTRILGVVAGRELMLGLGKVEGATVVLGIGGYNIDNKGNNSRNVAGEDKPAIALCINNATNAHGACKNHHGQHRQPNREFIAHHLSTTAHGTNECVLAIARPACQQDAQHTNRRHSNNEKHSNIHVDHLQAIAPRQACKHQHRRNHHKVGCQFKEELVGAPQGNNLLGQNLDDIGKHLYHTPRAHTHGAKATLNPCTQFALIENVDDGDDGIHEQQGHAHQGTFYRCRQPAGQEAIEQVINPFCDYTKVKHNLLIILM
ncbi:Uncharacterised protein [Chlamydia trachomatis]|nr:Uncharacterised protein [Chlamydia trachomatis]